MSTETVSPDVRANAVFHVLLASLVGTTIEFFDFYIYATAAVLVFPHLFFPASNAATATLASLATFGIAFLARPIGAALFGHFGDRIGRKTTLVLALSTMGFSTVAIGLLPTYASAGLAAPLLLSLCRFGQGIGLGGEWAGAVLLAVENAPPKKRAWYGMFSQLGAPLGFFLSAVVFLLLSRYLTPSQFLSYGWRLPFLASAVLVFVGLYVRGTIRETPVFRRSFENGEQVKAPMLTVFRSHGRVLLAGVLLSTCTFVIFYLMSVFTLSWGTSALGYKRQTFLLIQLVGVCTFALAIPISALFAERGRRRAMILATVLTGCFGLVMAPLFVSGPLGVVVMMVAGFAVTGFSYGPLGTVISELFPTSVRYTGSSVAFSLAGILGASFAPYIAVSLAKQYGLRYVGYYITAAAALSLVGLLMIREAKDADLTGATSIELESERRGLTL